MTCSIYTANLNLSMGCGISAVIPSGKVSKCNFVMSYVIGRGGFGKVYSAFHSESKTWVAVKEQRISKVLQHRNGISLINSELAALKVVGQHNFIVGLEYAFCDKFAFYMALRLCVGGDLRYHLRRREVFSERRVAFIVLCMASALNHIHNCGILHRDVKPENIIYDEDGYPYLTDFGVSYNSGIIGDPVRIRCHMASGTRQYLGPELFTSTHEHGHSSDYWSLGVLAYELIFSKRPFAKHCPVALIEYCEEFVHYQPEDTLDTIEKIDISERLDQSKDKCEAECCTNSDTTDSLPLSSPAQISSMTDFCDVSGSHDVSKGAETIVHKPIYDPDLATNLRVNIPNSPYGKLSASCKRVLARLLDPRASRRYGYNDLSSDSWFAEQDLNWEGVAKKGVRPPYTPDLKTVSMDVCSKYLFETASTDDGVTMGEHAALVHPEGYLLVKTVAEFYFVRSECEVETMVQGTDAGCSVSKPIAATCTGSNTAESVAKNELRPDRTQ